jgi:hypothetical protein
VAAVHSAPRQTRLVRHTSPPGNTSPLMGVGKCGRNQFPDGSLDDGSEVEPPQVWIYRADDNPLSSDRARELARAIMAAAEELDGLTDGTRSQ